MSNDAIILPGGAYSKDDVEYAANDAQTVTAQSKVIQTVVGVMIDTRRLYMLARHVLDVELTKGWDLQNPALVGQTIVLASERKALEAFSPAALQQSLLLTDIPFLDILIQQEQAYKAIGKALRDQFQATDAELQDPEVVALCGSDAPQDAIVKAAGALLMKKREQKGPDDGSEGHRDAAGQT